LETSKGKNVVLIGGGFGFSTLRALTNYMIEETNREEFKKITVIYGARRPGFLLYKSDLETWQNRSDIQVFLTVDQDDIGWHGKVGTVPVVTREVTPDAENTYALVCGPPAMIKYTLPVLKELGFPNERIFLSLEMRMKCGIGKCGRCNIGSKYVCQDGPVFSYAEILNLTSDDIF
jgi:NAD(P)H-flavin reductase